MININLNELTFDNVGDWPMPVKIGMTIALTIVVILLGYWMIVSPNFEQFQRLKHQEVALKAEFEQKQQMAVNLPLYQNQLKHMEDNFGAMLRQLPAENEMPGLLEDISKTGTASGLTFQSFTPDKEIIHDFYIELPIKISVIGTYHQLAIFISRVAAMNRIVTLHDFTIENVPKDKDKKDSPDLLVMNLTAKIYRYRTP